MLQVRVEIPRELRSLCGGAAELTLAGDSVSGLLDELARQHPDVHVRLCNEQGQPREHINVFVNENLCARTQLELPLMPGDTVTILPAVSGG